VDDMAIYLLISDVKSYAGGMDDNFEGMIIVDIKSTAMACCLLERLNHPLTY
jgi:hypothetical protein